MCSAVFIQNHMKKTSCMFEEAVVYCYEKKLEKQFEFRGKIYKSYNGNAKHL